MNRQETGVIHDKARGVLVRLESDLATGAETKWVADPVRGINTRVDTLEDYRQFRTITQTEANIFYEIESLDVGAQNHILIAVNARNLFSKEAYLQTMVLNGKKEQSISVVIGYNGSTDGEVSSVMLKVVPKTQSADRYSHSQGGGKSEFFNGRPFGENMEEIAEIWGLRGEKTFLDDNYQENGSGNQDRRFEIAVANVKADIQQKLEEEGIDREGQDKVVDGIYEAVKGKVEESLKGSLLQADDVKGIFSYLFAYTSRELIENFKSFEVGRALKKAAAQTLAYYYTHVGTIGQSQIRLMLDKENPGKLEVETESIDHEQGLEGRIGEGWSNGEYELTIDYSENSCVVSVNRLIGPKETIYLTFPRSVDIEDLLDQISQDGWAGFIKSLNLNHSSVRLQE